MFWTFYKCTIWFFFLIDTVAILTSVTVECYRAGRREDAFRYASHLMSSEHRKSIDDGFAKKIETILRRSAPVDNTGYGGDHVDGDHFSDCPYCNCSQSSMNTKCDNCQKKLPLCIISVRLVKKIDKNPWSENFRIAIFNINFSLI